MQSFALSSQLRIALILLVLALHVGLAHPQALAMTVGLEQPVGDGNEREQHDDAGAQHQQHALIQSDVRLQPGGRQSHDVGQVMLQQPDQHRREQ